MPNKLTPSTLASQILTQAHENRRTIDLKLQEVGYRTSVRLMLTAMGINSATINKAIQHYLPEENHE